MDDFPDSIHTIRASLLGPATIEIDGRGIPVADWTRRAARSLLLMLLGNPGHRVTRDLVFETLWPDLEIDGAANALYKTIHWLRRELEPQLSGGRSSTFLVLNADFVALAPQLDVWIDAEQFERWIMTRSNSPDARRAALRQSLQLYRGEFVADEPYLDWPAARRESLAQLWQRGVLEIAALDREAGEPGLPVPLLESLIERDPLLEAAHQELILCLLAAGLRNDAQRAYDRCARLLREELDIEPDERTRALLETWSAPADPSSRRQLPVAPSAIVGREQELDRIEALLADPSCRLITLTGPGGVGKTRLAIEAGWQHRSSFNEGAVFVPLASVRDAKQMEFVVASALGIRLATEERLWASMGDLIQGRSLLLILDNLEQVIEPAAAFVSGLLQDVPELRVIATSRERLRIRGEYEVPVGPLAVADDDRGTRAISNSDAVVLFTNLLRMQNPDFAITAENAVTIARICARLDGLPLALELAASRARRMRLETLLDALDDPLATLTSGARDLPDRHRSLRDAIAWSYELLTPKEQALLRSLSVYLGGVMEEDLEGILAGGAAAAESLADKSLAIWTDTVVGPRLSIMEAVRQFAQDEAIAVGDWDALRAAHALWVLEGATLAGQAYLSPEQTRWSRRIDLELENIRAALEWAFEEGDGQRVADIVTNINPYMELRGHYREGLSWAERALALGGMDDRTRIRLLQSAITLNFRLTSYVAVDGFFAEAVALAEAIGAEDLLAIVLNTMIRSPWYRANADEAERQLKRALEIHRRLGNKHGEAVSLSGLGTVHALRGDYVQAHKLDLEALEVARGSGVPSLILYLTANYSVELSVSGKLLEAEPWFHEAVRMAIELQDPTLETAALHGIALVQLRRGDVEGAIVTFQRVSTINRRTGYRVGYALALHELSRIAWRQGDLPGAAQQMREAITIFVADGIERWIIEMIDSSAAILLSAGMGETAARLFGHADQARSARNIGRMGIEDEFVATLLDDLASALGTESRDTLIGEGRLIPDADARALVLASLQTIAEGEALIPQWLRSA